MISLRYHVVSLSAVLLALALGVVVGASSLSGHVLGAVAGDRAELAARVDGLTADVEAADERLAGTERVVAAGAPAMVRDQLAGRGVAVIAAADADPADVAAVTDLVRRSGAQVTGRLDLTDAVAAPSKAEALTGLATRLLPAGAQLPSTTDPGALAGGLLGALVTARPGDLTPRGTPQETVTALTALADAGFVEPVPPVAPVPAQLAVVVAGGGDPDPGRAVTLARLAGALDRSGGGALLAARSAEGPVAAVRNDPALRSAVSSVDGLDRPSGVLAAVLGLREQADGRAGSYGSGPGATAPAPPPAPTAGAAP